MSDYKNNNGQIQSEQKFNLMTYSFELVSKIKPDKGDSEKAKVERECEALNHFLSTYYRATGMDLQYIEKTERPDFILERPDGIRIGAELVRITANTLPTQDDINDFGIEFARIFHTIEEIFLQFEKKDAKIKEPDWKYPESTILIMELIDVPLASIEHLISVESLPDVYTSRFEEIWLVDYTGLDAFNDVELFCICPESFAGYYPREPKKPYG